MLAGLPKAPSRVQPGHQSEAGEDAPAVRAAADARARLHHRRRSSREAQNAPLVVRQGVREALPIHAEFVAEMARQVVFERLRRGRLHAGASPSGRRSARADQEAAYAAVRRGVHDYDRRHGYRGPEAYVEPARRRRRAGAGARASRSQDAPDSDNLLAAVVLEAAPERGQGGARRRRRGRDRPATACKFAARALGDKAPPSQRIRRGAVIRLAQGRQGPLAIAQLPQVESAFVSVDPRDGAILALVGGFDFERNKFNHVTQAQRQPGSASSRSSTRPRSRRASRRRPSSTTRRSSCPADQAGGEDWEPKNYDGKFDGPMRLRTALAKSKNLVTVRVLQAIGPQYAQDYIARFGFDPKLHPAYLTMALGAGVGDAAADGERLLGVRQRRLSRLALPHRADHRRASGNVLSRGEAGDGRRRAPSA